MRGFILYLKDSDLSAIEDYLDTVGTRVGAQWNVPSATAPQLLVQPYDPASLLADNPETLALAIEQQGGCSAMVQVDVRGPSAGDRAARALAVDLLGHFEGLAQDDLTDELWTLASILEKSSAGVAGFLGLRGEDNNFSENDNPTP